MRPMALQEYRDGAWHEAETVRSSSSGTYSFTVTASSQQEVYRVFAPEWHGKDDEEPVGYSRRLRIATVIPTAEVAFGPPVAMTSSKGDSLPVEATFRPRRPGAPAQIQTRRSAGWVTASAGEQDATGRYAAALPAEAVEEDMLVRVVTQPAPSTATVRSEAVKTKAWRLVWNDDFDGDALDPDKWRTRLQRPGGRRLCASPHPSRVAVRDGKAVLSVKRAGPKTSTCPYGVFQNAMIGTSVTDFPGFATIYGAFAARVKFQSGRGQHGSFWMQSLPESHETGAEIDVAEYFGDGRADGGFSNFVHHTDADDKLTSAGGIRKGVDDLLGDGETPGNSFHVYSVEWSPEGYVFRLDGVPTFRTSKPYVATTPEFMVLSLLTSDWELPALTSTSSVMEVDWVRVWQQ